MKEKILVVEDDAFSREFYNFLLTKNGYEVSITDDIDQVLDILNEQNLVLVIMDVNLTNSFLHGKRVDGIKLTKYIKDDEKHSNIPVLIVTAHSYETEKQKILEDSCANALFPKPIFDFNKLLNTIDEIKRKVA